MTRILHVAESVRGGCGTYLNELLPVQSRQWGDDAIRVIVPADHVSQLPAVSSAQIATFVRNGRSVASLGRLAASILSEVRAFRPDVIHLHSTFAGLVGRIILLGVPAKTRIVYCAHGWAFDMKRSSWKLAGIAFLERLLGPLAHKIVAISEYERQRGLDVGIAPDRIVTVLNGLVDAPSSPIPAPADRLRLLFVGRLDAQKGWDVLVDAVEGLGDKVGLRLIGASVVGDATASRKLPSNVSLIGWLGQAEIAAELAGCDLVVVPSRWEGFGLVALEAMRAGRPVLASRVGGLPEVVSDGVTGRLFRQGDTVALRNAIMTFDPQTLVSMGEAGRRRFEDYFTIDRTAAGLARVYDDILGSGARR